MRLVLLIRMYQQRYISTIIMIVKSDALAIVYAPSYPMHIVLY